MVLVSRLDRFASVRYPVTALHEFHGLGVDFVSYSESLDTITPIGRAKFSLVGAFAEVERDVIRERAIEGQRRARARGMHVGSPHRVVDEVRILELRAQGLSLSAIARERVVSRPIVTRRCEAQ